MTLTEKTKPCPSCEGDREEDETCACMDERVPGLNEAIAIIDELIKITKHEASLNPYLQSSLDPALILYHSIRARLISRCEALSDEPND